jgi:two-component system phosphate regulon sensor histidine kinase PhoR
VRRRIFVKLAATFVLIIAATSGIFFFFVERDWEHFRQAEIENDLRQKTLMLAEAVGNAHQQSLQDLISGAGRAAEARATVIDGAGKILADSEADTSGLQNAAALPEFRVALNGGVGVDQRPSGALGIPFLYIAAPIPGGAVRMALPMTEMQGNSLHLTRALLLSAAPVLLLALVLAWLAGKLAERRFQRIVQFADQIAAGDLTARIAELPGDDIGEAVSALDRSARHLERSFTALQTSQRQLETMLNSMQDAVIAVGNDGRVQWANRRMDRLAPERTRLNAPVVETVRDPDFLRALRAAGESGRAQTTRAISVLPGRTYGVTAAPMPGGGVVAVLRDLTETERVEKTRRDFIANVSHELRTPLTSIQGYTETLLDSSGENGHTREFLEVIRKNAMRMSRLTEDLLTLARVESGEQRFDIQPVLPGDVLREAFQSFREIARAQEVDLQLNEEADTPVKADREAIHQVLSNLVENALKYGASGGRIVLGTRPASRGVEFYVRDFGPGISSEHVPRLFERFYRVDKARSRESGGTGLGLAIAKHIVLAHGGTIRAESLLSQGSTFVFTLPAA